MRRFRPGRRQSRRRFRFLGSRRARGDGRTASGARHRVFRGTVTAVYRHRGTGFASGAGGVPVAVVVRNSGRPGARGTRPPDGRVVRNVQVAGRRGRGGVRVACAGVGVIGWLGASNVRGRGFRGQRVRRAR